MDAPVRVERQHETCLIAWTPDYELRGETWSYKGSDERFLWLHATVRKWSPEIARRTKREWEAWRPLVDAPVFVRTTQDNKKLHKFLASYGFIFLGEPAPGDWVFVHYNDGGSYGRRRQVHHHD